VVFGAYDEKNGYRKSTGEKNPFHPKTAVTGGILEEPCSGLMKEFFKSKR
jgi:tRNA(adenine34) deaminase